MAEVKHCELEFQVNNKCHYVARGNSSNNFKKLLKLDLDSTLTSIKMIYYLGNNCI